MSGRQHEVVTVEA